MVQQKYPHLEKGLLSVWRDFSGDRSARDFGEVVLPNDPDGRWVGYDFVVELPLKRVRRNTTLTIGVRYHPWLDERYSFILWSGSIGTDLSQRLRRWGVDLERLDRHTAVGLGRRLAMCPEREWRRMAKEFGIAKGKTTQ